eukprot:CAMPEP_0115074176 /NCGR_PEP_ID=MMETSP0227-20121206/15202_1 /TAXON_ID=89957 /ORGANISM="Polarella glacialis, Strain CCMP 1383" /LENGTH=94 /DNA_ID=CAMNT_0002461129 /DNA_START=198 /DNA_END=485 /DNA_ORIENTATION=+
MAMMSASLRTRSLSPMTSPCLLWRPMSAAARSVTSPEDPEQLVCCSPKPRRIITLLSGPWASPAGVRKTPANGCVNTAPRAKNAIAVANRTTLR